MMTIDPVCGMEVDEQETELQTQYAGKKYSLLFRRVPHRI
jgi:YHS domain-containing protein